MIGFIGDVHGRYDSLLKILEAWPGVTRWFQIGDLGGANNLLIKYYTILIKSILYE